MRDMIASDYVDDLCLSFPKNPIDRVAIENEDRLYEFLGLLEIRKASATSYTLGTSMQRWYKTLNDIECLDVLNKYANKRWKQENDKFPKAELASYPAIMEFITTDDDVFMFLRGKELLTNTIITRKDGKTIMGIDPVIKDGIPFISEKELEIKEDLDGPTACQGKCIDHMYWSMSDWRAKTSGSKHSNFSVFFHNTPKDSNIEKTIPRVVLANDNTIHVHSDSPLERTYYLTEFPLVRRLR